jgi:hypothetical protein
MKIKSILLFTNRIVWVTDENNEQMPLLQEALRNSIPSWESYKTTDALEQIIEAKPEIYITKFQEWTHKISLEEFCYILGFGEWYWNSKQQKLAENKTCATPVDLTNEDWEKQK